MTKFFRGLIFPLVFIGSILGFRELLCTGMAPPLALFIATIVNFTIVGALEMAVPYRSEWAWWRDRQTINDLVHGVALSTLGPRLGEALMLTLAISAAAYISDSFGGGLWPVAWPLWGQIILAFVIIDFAEWGKHWLYHHWRYLWPVHALHHNPDRLHVAKGARLHFLEATIRYGVISVPLIVLGAPPEVLFWYAALINFLGNLNHSNIDMPMPGFMHYLIATPQVHRLHHALDSDLGQSNLSGFTMLPDLLFGTFRHPSRHPLWEIGIEDNPIPNNILAQLLSPILWPFLIWRRRAKGAQ